MDEVDVAVHIEPLVEALRDLKEQLALSFVSLDGKIDTMTSILNHQFEALNRRIDIILERTAPKSNCVFCSIEDNNDSHPTGRCCRFRDAVSRAVQAANLRLCNRCLQPRHANNCGVVCSYCSQDHNVLLCPHKYSSASSSFKRRKI
ncbi:hypothetical protein GCK32_000992 [Trichostrongylus colubriformis]|uniref:Uncharacterized protein n=1 Tax=Trichostrongylus colubriformis TaxID=6319 RepID=A0AAN8FUM1_TRICO